MKLPNGYGSVYKLKGKRRKPFTAVVTTGKTKEGKIIRKTLGYYATREEGLDALALYRKAPVEAENQQLTVSKVIKLFIEYRNKINKPIARNYLMGLRRIKKIGNMAILDVRTRHLQEIINEINNLPSACIITKSSMTMLFKYAIMEDYAKTNYASYVVIPEKKQSTKHKPFTHKEIDALWKRTDVYAVRIALILIYTGMRAGELCALKKSNIHLKERYMIGGLKTKAGIDRTIPIAEKIVPLLKLNDPLPDSTQSIYFMWNKSEVPELRHHLPHDGRHTCETLLHNAGVNDRIIQLIIGHTGRNIDETVYIHKTNEQLIEAINKI